MTADRRSALARALVLALVLAGTTGGAKGQETLPSPAPSPQATAPGGAPAGEDASALPKPPQVRTRKGFAIRITNPAHNDFRFGRSEIDAEVTAADPALVDKVEFYVDDRLVFIDTEAPYQCFFDFGTEPRSWVIRATAWHKEGVTV